MRRCSGSVVAWLPEPTPRRTSPADTRRTTRQEPRPSPSKACRERCAATPHRLANITLDGINIDCGGVKTSGGCYEAGNADNGVFKNGAIGNVVDEKGALVDGSHFTFDNVRFHDARLVTDGVHMECLYAIVVPYMTIRNSTFTACDVFDVFFT